MPLARKIDHSAAKVIVMKVDPTPCRDSTKEADVLLVVRRQRVHPDDVPSVIDSWRPLGVYRVMTIDPNDQGDETCPLANRRS